jgi:hypothetical protein
MRSFIIILLVLLSLTLPARSEKIYPIGEKFEMKAYALGVIPIGTAWVDISSGSYNNIPTITFNGRCYGNYMVYLADVRLRSELSKETDQSLFHYIEQYGTERRGRRLYFNWESNEVTYVRWERDGKYRLRAITKITPDVWDVFGCGLHARAEFPTEIGETMDLKLIEMRKVFHIRFKAVEHKMIDIPDLGIFKAAKIKFEAINLKKDEIFKGLLDLDKDMELWLETSTKTPILFSSTVPFGIIRPTVTVVLKKWEMVPGFEPVTYTRAEMEKFNREQKEKQKKNAQNKDR